MPEVMKDCYIRLSTAQIAYLDSRAERNQRSRAAELRFILDELERQEPPAATIKRKFQDSQGVVTQIEVENPAYVAWLKTQPKGRSK